MVWGMGSGKNEIFLSPCTRARCGYSWNSTKSPQVLSCSVQTPIQKTPPVDGRYMKKSKRNLLAGLEQTFGGKLVEEIGFVRLDNGILPRGFKGCEFTAEQFRLTFQLVMRAVELHKGFLERAVLGLELFELLLEMLNVLLLALTEGALGGAVLCSTTLK